MAINPMKLMQFQKIWNEFTARHPKFPQFLTAVSRHGISAGTVIEVQIRTPDGEEITTNLRVTEEDIQAIRNLQE